MSKYTHLFFDLDRTLWDMERNAHETLSELFYRYGLNERGVPSADVFVSHYNEYNNLLWDRYRRKLIDKSTLRALRFKQALAHFGIHDKKLAEQFDHDYITEAPRKTNLIEGAIDLLDSLHGKFELHIITNGFPEVQEFKMRNSGLDKYFGETITSEGVGHAKPDKRIFQHALRLTKAEKTASMMIGDDLHADIVGAREAGWDHVYFNPERGPHNESVMYEVEYLTRIAEFL
jgi:putative hydrolase of the HAD superfamily